MIRDFKAPKAIVEELRKRVLTTRAPDNLTAVCIRVGAEIPLPTEVDKYEQEESDLLLKVAEERKDYGANVAK